MATIDELPEQYRATAERIPEQTLKALRPAEAVARVMEHNRRFEQGLAMGSALDAQPYFAMARKALSALPAVELQTSLDALERGRDVAPPGMAGHYVKAAKQLQADNPQPAQETLDKAAAAVATARPGGQQRWTREAPSITRSAPTTDNMLYKRGGS